MENQDLYYINEKIKFLRYWTIKETKFLNNQLYFDYAERIRFYHLEEITLVIFNLDVFYK